MMDMEEWEDLAYDDRSLKLKVFQWIIAPVYAPLAATLVCFLLMGRSFVSDALGDFIYRWPRWFNLLFWRAYYPTASYYQWKNSEGRKGPFHWLWRVPKHPRWYYCGSWWVFRI